MLNLKVFFKNHFDTNAISDANLRKFAETHIACIYANNTNGQYNQMLQDTQRAFDVFSNAINQEDIVFSQQQGNTIRVDDIIEQFKQYIRKKEGLVRSEYGIDSPEYQEFFPLGLTEYSQISKTNAEMLIQRVADAASNYANSLGNNFAQSLNGYLTSYRTARANQLQKIGTVSVRKTETASARTTLERQLMRNILNLAAEFLEDTSKVDSFFDQSIVRRANVQDDGSITDEVPANQIINIEQKTFAPTTTIELANTGATLLQFGLSDKSDELLSGIGIMLIPNEKRTVHIQELGDINHTFLNSKNLSTSDLGKFKVLIL